EGKPERASAGAAAGDFEAGPVCGNCEALAAQCVIEVGAAKFSAPDERRGTNAIRISMALEIWRLKVRPDFVSGSQRSTAILMIVSSGGLSVVPEKLTKRRLYCGAHCSGSAREVDGLAVRAV